VKFTFAFVSEVELVLIVSNWMVYARSVKQEKQVKELLET